ncbi:MAG TPA: aminotransferase class I/II-fold pyridoxal phosphate-dependent enzyme [Stellaceae bacterium]|nr:aminotransferase class I/II-fold pyridoxal phosphate-dependent enzyme [Stellaceae bacterium]
MPGYEELRLMRAAGGKFGVHSPYFRLHEGRAAAYTEIAGKRLLNFSSYDYLGLNGHPEVVEAAKAAIERYGVSASASRLVAGERPAHLSLERALAAHYGVDDAVAMVSGYATNLGVIGALVGAKDLLILDSLVHNSAVMGGVLSHAARRNFPHNDLDQLDELLTSIRDRYERVLIVVEGLYSMDGDYPDLPRLIEIKRRHDAWLMIDEAHALGVLGPRGYGVAEHFAVDGRDVDIWMGTLSKTLAGCGGFIAGSADLVDFVKHLVGVFVYSVGMPPVIAAAADKALEIMHREPARVARLQYNGDYFRRMATERGLDTGNGAGTAVCPVIVGDSLVAMMLSQRLLQRGVNVQPVAYPAVPAKTSRLRFFLSAVHDESDMAAAIDMTLDEVSRVRDELRSVKAVS